MTPLLKAGSRLVFLVTIVLFAVAAATHGLTHDLLLETAVFLVSLKLMLASAHQSTADREILKRLASIERKLTKLEREPEPRDQRHAG